MNKKSEKKPSGADVMLGGQFVDVVYKGEARRVFVRQVKPSELLAYLQAEATGDEPLIELVTLFDGSSVSADDFDLESLEAILEADRVQNFTHARRKAQREADRAKRHMDMLRETSPETFAKMMESHGEAFSSLMSSVALSIDAPAVGAPQPKS